MSERPVQARPRRLADWINPTGARKVHSLVESGSIAPRSEYRLLSSHCIDLAFQQARLTQTGRGYNFRRRDGTLSIPVSHRRGKFKSDSESPGPPCGVSDIRGAYQQFVGLKMHLGADGHWPQRFQ